MAGPETPPPGFRVTGLDPSPTAERVLRAVVTAFGGQVAPLEEAPEPTAAATPSLGRARLSLGKLSTHSIVRPEELAEISQALWGDPVYGEATQLFLPKPPQSLSPPQAFRRLLGDGPAIYETYAFGFDDDHSSREKLRPRMPTDNDSLQAWVLAAWERAAARWPYTHTMEWQGKPRELRLTETYLDRDRLGSFCDSQRLMGCTYKGSLGKAADVLLVAAGRLSKTEVDPYYRQVDSPLVKYDDFIALARSALTPHYPRSFQNEIKKAIISQARNPYRYEGVTVEGEIEYKRKGPTVRSELITISSIEHVSHRFNRETMQEFLNHLGSLPVHPTG